MLQIKKTIDGSCTLYNSDIGENYHSLNGAIQESEHVFINAGLKQISLDRVKIFEVGFGTGLNTFLSYIENLKSNIQIEYFGIEKYPVEKSLINELNYSELISPENHNIFEKLHECKWNKEIEISENFRLKKIEADFNEYILNTTFDLIYFDAFAPDKQPDMWSQENFNKLFKSLNKGGILVTYSSKGMVKQNLRNAGFKVQRLQGPPGKRHMLRAIKV